MSWPRDIVVGDHIVVGVVGDEPRHVLHCEATLKNAIAHRPCACLFIRTFTTAEDFRKLQMLMRIAKVVSLANTDRCGGSQAP